MGAAEQTFFQTSVLWHLYPMSNMKRQCETGRQGSRLVWGTPMPAFAPAEVKQRDTDMMISS